MISTRFQSQKCEFQSAGQFQASGSVEQPSSEVSVEQFRLSASVEQDRDLTI